MLLPSQTFSQLDPFQLSEMGDLILHSCSPPTEFSHSQAASRPHLSAHLLPSDIQPTVPQPPTVPRLPFHPRRCLLDLRVSPVPTYSSFSFWFLSQGFAM